jgi:hypothetical protein
MVESKKKGKNAKVSGQGYDYNAVNESDYQGGGGGDDGHIAGGKSRHGGVGGKASKSTNFKECKNANIRRNAKN